uniref:Potassium large conductance calcium-activated channel, subfamily M, beta member 2 n=1 Tax=Echeneis naucrates TaxID=173247 RepID=A0A665TGW9_ECHNA
MSFLQELFNYARSSFFIIRSIYQKFHRAIFLGLGMILSSVMMFFVLGITTLRSYAESVWTEEGICVVLNSTVTADMNCSYNCGSDCWRVSKYPCLQVYVSVNNTGRVSRLSHNEETQDASSEVSIQPEGKYGELLNRFKCLQRLSDVPCYYDPSEQQEAVLLTRLYDHSVVFHSLLWPSCMFTGGALIIVMVKLTQYLSRLCEEIGKIKR